MTVHLVKLCVGADDIGDLVSWQNHLQKTYGKVFHTTRMVPKREADLLEGGSIYWVIKRQIRVRQRIIDIEPFTDGQGTSPLPFAPRSRIGTHAAASQTTVSGMALCAARRRTGGCADQY